jgi:osmotically-inducible protein OsmY
MSTLLQSRISQKPDSNHSGKAPAIIVEQAQFQLRNLPYSSLKKVCCEYSVGQLVLRGRLPSYFLKQIAQTAAAQVDGVERVVNQIEVRGRATVSFAGPTKTKQLIS